MKIASKLKRIVSPVDEAMLLRLRTSIGRAFTIEGKPLRGDHPWKEGKWKDGMRTARLVGKTFAQSGLSLETLNLLRIMCLAHDIGRLPHAVMREKGESHEPTMHGHESVRILKPILGTPLGELWDSVAEAIDFHSYPSTPASEEFLSPFGEVLCHMLRDLDKAGGFGKSLVYTKDEDEKRRQANANDLAWSDENPTAETGRIDTVEGEDDVLEAFLAGKTIIRAHCASYEAYMLQLLGWLNDFNTEEVQKQVIKDGGPGIVLSYLRGQLGAAHPQFKQIENYAKNAWNLEI